MAARSNIINSPPYAVEQVIKTLGNNIRTARLRRGLTCKRWPRKSALIERRFPKQNGEDRDKYCSLRGSALGAQS